MKKVNIKTFWNGTVVSDLEFTAKQYKLVQKQLSMDFFKGADNINEFIEVMDHNEEVFAQDYSKKGSYDVGDKSTQIVTMLGINTIVKKGIRPNDDKYGIIIMKY